MAKDLEHILKAVGFSPREARLYLAGLQLGSAAASDYAKRVNLNRVTTYNSLEALTKNGYFTVEKRTRSKFYAPVSPEFLAVEAQKNVQALDRVMPELRSLQGTKFKKPIVRFFEGWDGVQHMYADSLNAKGEILNFANSTVLRTQWPDYDEEYVAKRVERGIKLRGIAPNDETGKKVQGEDNASFREIRLVSDQEFDFTNEINIYNHKVSIISFEEGDVFGVIIESSEIAKTQKQIFEMAWRYAAHSN